MGKTEIHLRIGIVMNEVLHPTSGRLSHFGDSVTAMEAVRGKGEGGGRGPPKTLVARSSSTT